MNNMNTIAIICVLPLILLWVLKGKATDDSTQLQKNFTFLIFKLLPLTSLFIWSNMLLNSCSK